MSARRQGTFLYFIDIATVDLRRFDCANKQQKKLSLKLVELASRSLSVSLLVVVSRAVFLKVGNIAPLGGEREAPGGEKQKGAIAHERVRPFFALHRIFLCELGNSHLSVALALVRLIKA